MRVRRIAGIIALLVVAALVLAGCGGKVDEKPAATAVVTVASEAQKISFETEAPREEAAAEPVEDEVFAFETALPTAEPTEEAQAGPIIEPQAIADYIFRTGGLPDNFLTKEEAQALGWDSSRNYVSDVAPGKSIGGDYFGNYEGLLPKGGSYRLDGLLA